MTHPISDSLQVAFIGAGQMATALASGFCRSLLKPECILAADPHEDARARFCARVGSGAVCSAPEEADFRKADLIVIAVKPHLVQTALKQSRLVPKSALFLSIAAGVPLKTLEELLPTKARVIRAMPNTPCLIGCGACGISRGSHASAEDAQSVTSLLSSVGIVETVPEHLLDAVTGLSGSGPAYVFQFIEALSDAGVRCGLPRATATRLAAQTVSGAAAMVLQSGEHPAVLKDQVTSPGGTTIAGLHALEQGGLRAAVINAVVDAATRSAELGRRDD